VGTGRELARLLCHVSPVVGSPRTCVCVCVCVRTRPSTTRVTKHLLLRHCNRYYSARLNARYNSRCITLTRLATFSFSLSFSLSISLSSFERFRRLYFSDNKMSPRTYARIASHRTSDSFQTRRFPAVRLIHGVSCDLRTRDPSLFSRLFSCSSHTRSCSIDSGRIERNRVSRDRHRDERSYPFPSYARHTLIRAKTLTG